MYGPVRRFRDNVVPSRRSYRRESLALYSRFIRPGDLAFDVGANIGMKTQAFLALGARVVAVEPQPSCQRVLMAMFGSDPNFTLVPKAVGNAPGRATMHIAPMSALSSLRADWFPGSVAEIEVEVTTLDSLIATHGEPRFCKIDVEGFELEVLQGLTHRLAFLSLEYGRGRGDRLAACLDYLERYGPIAFNFSRAEEQRAVSDGWLSRERFLDRLRIEFDRDKTLWGGDVYLEVGPAEGGRGGEGQAGSAEPEGINEDQEAVCPHSRFADRHTASLGH
jgi:FkbM family methyltransferase